MELAQGTVRKAKRDAGLRGRLIAMGVVSVLLLVSCGHLTAIHPGHNTAAAEYIPPQAEESQQGVSLKDHSYNHVADGSGPEDFSQNIPLISKDDPILSNVKIRNFDWPMVANTGTYTIYEPQEGVASFYQKPQKLATGEHFDPMDFSAAHRTLPFGTIVRVTRLDTEAEVIVTINDRGPYVKGRIIDLSLAAAQKLEMVKNGVVDCRVEVLAYPLVETMGPNGNG